MKCRYCGARNSKGDEFCGECGAKLPLSLWTTTEESFLLYTQMKTVKCEGCGTANPEGRSFCRNCGAKLLQTQLVGPMSVGDYQPHQLQKTEIPPGIRTGYAVGRGLTAAIFFGLFYWAIKYTWTERVWRELYNGLVYWEAVTRTIDPAIQALFLVIAIVGVVTMIYGFVSRR